MKKKNINKPTGKSLYKISGMDCDSCAKMIELDLEDAGITARCSYSESSLEITHDHDSTKVIKIIKKSGYNITTI
ncbi:MAG TPA: cation transporter [Patescibacteria group bacterium]|nr:cation transporter [Patescibacteria group bacterium]